MIPLSHIRRVYTISRDSAIEILAYLAVSSIVMGNLLVADGYIFSLDPFFISKPQDKFYGLDVAWISGYLPFLLILRSLSHIVEPWVLQRILMFLILFLSGISAHKLCPTESHTGRLFAGLLYALNPFVYVRFMVGHWFILLGYSIMPLAVAKMIDLTQKPSLHQVVRAALLLTLVGIFSAHILFLCLLVSLIFLFYRLLQSNERLQLLKVFGTVSLLFFLLNMYWLMPGLSEKTVIEEFGYRDLLVFKSKILSEDVNIIFSLASMHGFWRQPEGYYYVSDMLPGYFLIYMFILFLTVRGFIEKHNDEKLGAYVTGLAVAAAVSLVLAIGISVEQLSSFFEFLFDTFFFFKGFREPQKLVGVLALAYAFLGGIGLEALYEDLNGSLSKCRRARKRSFVILFAALISPVLYSANMLCGFNGQLRTSNYPKEWYQVKEYLNSQKGDFGILFFPWHRYMRFSWTDRITTNPALEFFSCPVVQGENIEVGEIETQSTKPVQHYIHFLLDNRNEITNFGEFIAPLNLRYIVLAKEVDYREYNFLYYQEDLETVLENTMLVVFENKHQTAEMYWAKDIYTITDWDELIEISKQEDLLSRLYVIGEAPSQTSSNPEYQTISYTELSPIQYNIETRNEGYLIFTEPYNEGWTLDGKKPLPNLGLTNAFPLTDENNSNLYFEKFNLLLLYYITSLGTFIALIAALTIEWRGVEVKPSIMKLVKHRL